MAAERHLAERASSGAIQTVLGLVANWVEALHGQYDIEDVTRSIMVLCKAECAMLVRAERRSESIRRFVFTARDNGYLQASGGSTLVAQVLGGNRFQAKPGTTWTLSDRLLHGDPFDQPASTGPVSTAEEAIIIVLGRSGSHVDYLELQFAQMPHASAAERVRGLAATLASSWERRSTGTVQRLLSTLGPRKAIAADTPPVVPVMDATNPMHLSRSEFRVCALVKEGLTTKRIAESLSVHEATVRSHLSSIYAKTATSGIVELIHRLNAFDGVSLGLSDGKIANRA